MTTYGDGLSNNIESIITNNVIDATLATSLSSTLDSINVNKMDKGGVVTALSAASGDSSEVDCSGFNAVLVHVNGSATVYLKGCLTSGGSFFDCYEGATQMTTGSVTTGRTVLFKGIPDYIKVNASASCTVKVQPLNM